YRPALDSARPVCHLRHYDEAMDLRALRYLHVCPPECPDEYLAAVAGPFTSADMAWGGARCAACPGAGELYGDNESDSRQAVRHGGQCLAAYDDGLFAKGSK